MNFFGGALLLLCALAFDSLRAGEDRVLISDGVAGVSLVARRRRLSQNELGQQVLEFT